MTPDPLAERILVLTPTGRDGPMIVRVVRRAGMAAEVCRDIHEFCREWEKGAGSGVIAEEALAPESRACMVEHLRKQPVWSDFPLIILTGGGHTTRATTTMAQALESKGNVTLLERPLRILTLVSALQSALRARRRQYEVRRLLEETRQAVEHRDQFLAMLAHELRNPLSPIRNSLQILKHRGINGQVAEQAREMAERQVQHMARLLDDLLEVARISRGKIELRKEVVELAPHLQGTVEAVRPLAAARNHELRVSFPAEPLFIEADPTRLEQVMTNLLNNACKYTDPGGTIWLSVEQQGTEAVLRVRDNGIGISAEKLPKIFDLFVQAERRLDRSQGGIGIGLTLVRKLVELHGGTVEAFSAGADQGSEFIVRLPLVRQSRPWRDQSGGNPVCPSSVPSFRILIADDNWDAADSLAMMLRLTGHEVHAVHDGQEAVEAAERFRPDLALLDIGMPKLNGFQAARQIREQLGSQAMVLVAITGWGQEEDKRRAIEAGFDHHLTKPVDPTALFDLLARSGLPD